MKRKLFIIIVLLIISIIFYLVIQSIYFTPIAKCSNIDDIVWTNNNTIKWIDKTCDKYNFNKQYGILNKRFLILGDSLSRRFAITMAHVILGSNDFLKFGSDIFSHGKLLNIATSNIDFFWSPCINKMIKNINTMGHKYDFIILSSSIHYKCGECMKRNFKTDFRDMVAFIKKNNLRNTKYKIWWRTQPLSSRESSIKTLYDNYNFVMQYENSITIIDHFKIMLNRSIGVNRIKGNTKDHFGTEARIAMVQHFMKFYNKNF